MITRQSVQMIKTLVMGLGIMNIIFGFAMGAYLELPGKIMVSSGVGLIALYVLIWIWQMPTTEKGKQQSESKVDSQ